MAENSGSGGGSGGLYFIVGALVVAVVVVGFVAFGGHLNGHGGGATASAPKVELNLNPAAGGSGGK